MPRAAAAALLALTLTAACAGQTAPPEPNAVQCVSLTRIRETHTIDDQTLLFVMSGGKSYIEVDLANRCTDITLYGYGHQAYNNEFCRTDLLHALGPIPVGCTIKSMRSIDKDAADALLRRQSLRHHSDDAPATPPAQPSDTDGQTPNAAPPAGDAAPKMP